MIKALSFALFVVVCAFVAIGLAFVTWRTIRRQNIKDKNLK